jgi:heme A synthase
VLLLPVPNILPSTLFTNIRTLFSTRNQVQYTHKTTDKIIVSCISVFRIETRLHYFVFMFIAIIIIDHSYTVFIAKERSWKTTEKYPLMKLRRLGFAYTCALSCSVAGIMAYSTAATARNVVNICSPDLFRNTLFKRSWKQRIPQDLPQHFELNHIRPRITLFLHTQFLTTCTLLHDPQREDVT